MARCTRLAQWMNASDEGEIEIEEDTAEKCMMICDSGRTGELCQSKVVVDLSAVAL